MDVRSIPSPDPASPEHLQRAQLQERRRSHRRQLAFSVGIYVLVTAGLALCPGMVFNPRVVAFYAVGGLLVSLSMIVNLLGSFLGAFVQGTLSLLLLLNFGPVQPFAFFMLLGHLLLPMVFHQWVDLIEDANH